MKTRSLPTISVRTSLGLVAAGLLLRLVPIPLDGDLLKGLAFWVVLAAYGVLLGAPFRKKR